MPGRERVPVWVLVWVLVQGRVQVAGVPDFPVPVLVLVQVQVAGSELALEWKW